MVGAERDAGHGVKEASRTESLILSRRSRAMKPEAATLLYTSSIPFSANRVRAAAMYCSDGRFGEQVDQLLHDGLDLPCYDRLAVPGGAACLASHFYAYREEEAVLAPLGCLA